ncbi:ATP-dependent DNA helicase RecQ [Butyricicoccus sp. AF22-28AC]|jgi:RecQ family ATP-dependent DNA helicase|nr:MULTISPECIES: RecQ family ATP-dependent DNA helicase [unclassified Butyricicoccus]RGM77556.1 ATP-dependent DNA helicase RecQ [Butyricicoccus sp. OM06-6AC]RHQ71001.1 ATP-dependent DNA helicase RecQ [Butyricicoccus sp. AF24-19AC]RHQ81525.1 ATP-dependent DNA helicase RecQ [Butyricicoccus sp. AF22-28AC]RHR85004.1 ATP-dependent DNA helicase RecQ [Butyricicoccus sp. AF15-40]
MDMKRHLKSALKQLGFDKPRKAQIIPMNTLDAGQGAIVIAATGSGKQVIYETVGLAHSDKLTIVIEPLLALIYNQVQTLQEHGVSADYIDMTRSKEEIDKILHKACKGKLNFLYVTPERLQNHAFIEAMQHSDIFMVVIDECHSITEWGYTFRDAYLHIGDFINKLKRKPVICACSATISADSLNIIHDSLHMDKPAVLRSDLRRDNLILLKKDVTCQKKTLEERLEFRIKKLCKTINKYHKDGSVLIFAQTTTYVDALYNILEEKYPDDVTRYHSRIKPERRKKQLLFDFLQGKGKIMIVTSAFSMGIDVPDIELVVHFNAPISMTDYIQQIGRAGRDGRKAHCVLFYDQNGDDDAISASFIKKAKKQSPKAAKTIKARLSQVRDFINSNNCMVCDILEYQGQHEVKTCKRCTVCAQKRRNSK